MYLTPARFTPFSRVSCYDLQFAHVALRVAPPVGGRSVRLDQPEVLVHHQGTGVGFEDLRRDTDGVEGLVKVERSGDARVAVRDQRYSLTQSCTPRLRLAGVVSDLIR